MVTVWGLHSVVSLARCSSHPVIELVVVCDAWPACLHIGHVLGFVKCLERCTSSYPPHAEHRSVLTTFCALRVCSADALVWQCVWAEVAAQITLLTCSFELSLRAYSRECCPARCLAEILSLHVGGLCFGSCCCANLAHFLSTTTPLGAAVGHGCLNCSGARGSPPPLFSSGTCVNFRI